MDILAERVGVEKKFYDICQKVTATEGFVLYDMKYISGSQTLQMFIMDVKTETALIEDCARIDNAMTEFLQEDWVPDGLVLEVSSPGVYRELSSLDHFKNSLGSMVLFTMRQKLDESIHPSLPKALKNQKKLRALVSNVTDEAVDIDVDGYKINLKFIDIRKANLDPSWEDLKKSQS